MNIEKILENHFLWLLGNTLGMKAHLVRANLQEANLWKANLRKANLWKANLQEANLQEANLWEANLQEANLQEADLWEADLRKANLWKANLQEADLREANLQEADLREANLQDAVWGGIHFPKTQNNRITNYYKNRVFCGCFAGSLAEFKRQVAEKQDGCERKSAYLAIIAKIENS